MGYPDSKERWGNYDPLVSGELLHVPKCGDRFGTWVTREGAQPLPLFNELQFTCPISGLLKSPQ